MTPQEIQSRLEELCPGAVTGAVLDVAQPWLEIEPLRLEEVARALKEHLGFDRLLCVSGIDWEGYDEKGKGKHREINKYDIDGKVIPVTEPGTGDLGAAYHLEALATRDRLVLKVRMPRDDARAASTAAVWPTAIWHERETYDMYGIDFVGHPDLRRLLLPEDWDGHPLRKDYQMPARYNEVPLEGLPLAVREKQEAEAATEAAETGEEVEE
jgi:NADH-quinone oxidoreductase subunit C